MTKPTLPTVHLNGTSRQTLADGYFSAYQRLNEAIAAFNAIEFNARDYYVKGPGAWHQASAERRVIGLKLNDVHEYLTAHLIELGE